ncbi:MAG: GNAT family N-acetyltransferase [Planctomycetota bacterium]
MELRGQVVRGAGSIDKLDRDWDELFERAHRPAPYLSRAWIQTFISERHIKGTPLLITVWCDSRLVALLPLAVSSFCGIRVAMLVPTNVLCYTGVLVDPDCHEAIRALADICVREKVAHVFYNKYTSSKDEFTNELFTELSRHRFVCRHWQRHVGLQVYLEQSFDRILRKTRTRMQRQKLLYHERRVFKSGGVKVARYIGKQITPEIMARIADIQENSWVKAQGAAVLGQAFYQRLLVEMGKADLGCVWLMTKSSDDIAFLYAFRVKNSLYPKWMAYKHGHGYSSTLSFGKVLVMQVIRDACNEGICLLDLGFGEESWKRLWASDSHNIERIIAGRGLIGETAILCYGLLQWCARCKYLVYRFFRNLKKIRKKKI